MRRFVGLSQRGSRIMRIAVCGCRGTTALQQILLSGNPMEGFFHTFALTINRIMAQEIERKFLVCGDFKADTYQSTRIIQGYLSSVPRRIVRVRVKGDKGYITIKGQANATGVSRFEWEKEISVDEALSLLELAEPGRIDKTRYLVKNTDGKHVWEVDEFHGDNEGLVMAEIELAAEDEPFDKPDWLGKEVTGDPCYYNSMLKEHPFKLWK